jgi:hypothetical protein
MAAGKGIPIASANNRPKVSAYPWRAIRENRFIDSLG